MLALFLQGSSGGHMLLVEHTRCAEHGDLVHAGETHHHGAAEVDEADVVTLHGAPAESGEESHEHCAFSADRRDALASAAGTQALRWTPEEAIAASPVAHRHESRPELFRVAPKTSPPV
jgi:hypothetical protein